MLTCLLNVTSRAKVCHSGTCRSHGSEAVLVEIEELVKAVGGNCSVEPSGCLGYCRQASSNVPTLFLGVHFVFFSFVLVIWFT